MDRRQKLQAIKFLHTAAWAVFAGCIVAIPIVATLDRFDIVVWLIALVMLEIGILLANRWSCPLTAVAARYTEDRADNFDIYLPNWLARHNKVLFGTLFVAGVAYAVVRWTAKFDG